MAHVRKTPSGTYTCTVGICLDRHPRISKNFNTKKEAVQWGIFREKEIRAGSLENIKGESKRKWLEKRYKKDNKNWRSEFNKYLTLANKFETKEFNEYQKLKNKFQPVEEWIESFFV